jgi:hypothetical protein
MQHKASRHDSSVLMCKKQRWHGKWREAAYHEEMHSRGVYVCHWREVHDNVEQLACASRQLDLCPLLELPADQMCTS